MRIAIQDSWPNLVESAEREFIERFRIACKTLAIECRVVVTSTDILGYDPDIVLTSHEFSRKLTGYPTIGLIWSPLSFFQDDPYRVKSLLSYDGYLAGNRAIATHLRDMQAGLGVRKPIADDLFLPTTYTTSINALENNPSPSLCYIGVHWDGGRHRDLFDVLGQRGLITCYGPEQSWRRSPETYGGPLPFDGRSVVETIGKHGLALCLHKTEHRLENTPSMRIFEALSVGAVPVCDDIAFARQHLSEFATFVDMTLPAGRIVDGIEGAIDRVRRNPAQALDTAKKAKRWFDANWSLEAKIRDTILPFLEEVKRIGHFTERQKTGPAAVMNRKLKSKFASAPKCEVVMRSGGRELSFVERSIRSVKAANSEEFPLGMIIVDYKGRVDLEALCLSLARPNFPIRYIRSASTGFRSTALWDGLMASKAPFTAHLDDDDTVLPNHYRQLAKGLEHKPNMNVCYTGVIRVEDEDGYYVSAPNYDGPRGLVIKEQREVKFLEPFDLEKLAKFDNYIQSNAWMARTPFLQSVLGEDPELVVVEDVYLYLLMAAHGPFAFTGSPTALWHWRSRSSENSMMSVDQLVWAKSVERVKLRLGHIPFRSTATFARLLNPPSSGVEAAPQVKIGSLPPLNFNQAIEGGISFKAASILDGFHEPEIGGIWSKNLEATVLIPLGHRVKEEGGFLLVECLGSMTDVVDRWIELEIQEGARERLEIHDWSLKTVKLPLPSGSQSPLILKMRSSHLIGPGEAAGKERRELGGFIQSVRALAQADDQALVTPASHLASGSLMSVSCTSGFAHGTLTVRKRVAMWAHASTPGTLYVGGGENIVSMLTSDTGEFYVLPRLAEASEWFVFKSSNDGSDGELRFEFTDDALDIEWTTLVADATASVRDHRSLNDGEYQHAAVTLTGSKLIDAGPKPLYFLIQNHNGFGWWEIRPSYGPAWEALYDLGEEGVDDHGRYRRGPLSELSALVASPIARQMDLTSPNDPRTFTAVAIMRSVLVGAVRTLAIERAEVPASFLSWTIDQLLPK